MGRTIWITGFPSTTTEAAAKRFVEKFTGEGSVVALKMKQYQDGARRFFAIVQFATETQAALFLNLAGAEIWYDPHNFLKAKMMGPGADLIPTPTSDDLTLEHLELNFGCQVSENRFAVLWKGQGIKLNGTSGLNRLCFEFRYNNGLYKLQLSYLDIWKIQVRHLRGRGFKYLLIQLFRAPKIYEHIITSKSMGHGWVRSFGKVPDDQWGRSTDFTTSGCIGQSSGLCLKVPVKEPLAFFEDNFHFYEEKHDPFVLENGTPYSSNNNNNNHLVPVVHPPVGAPHLPFEILYKVNLLVQNGCLAGPNLDVRFYRLLDPKRTDISIIEFCLQKLYYQNECCYDPVGWLTKEYSKWSASKRPPQRPTHSLDDGLVYVRRVQVTPCKVYFCDPQVNESNRVLRTYPDDIDNFLRVSFVDEDLDKLYSTDLAPRGSSIERANKLYERILSTLRNGIVIGDKHFEFLAFSSSQLKENSLWMFASRPGLSADDIRRKLGNFSKIRNVAKYAARLGQSLSSSKESLSVGRRDIEKIPDVKTLIGKNEYIFSDGIGKISAEFALKVVQKCYFGRHKVPSAFQIRYGGYKGVVAVDPKSRHKLSLRPSMCKYESNEVKLDVLAYSRCQPCYLNRQLITLLSTLGVRDQVFEERQRVIVEQLDAILKDPLVASEALELMPSGENTHVLKEMLHCGYKPDSEPFLSLMLQNFRSSKLLELRTKSRICIPEGRLMMGCLDETRTLDYGQVFLQISNPNKDRISNFLRPKGRAAPKKNKIVKTGKVVVAKNPCLHPGDVRVLTAIDVPALRHMVDCIVFPQKGKRPHPNECSGSDLDGDLYFVSWDPDLRPPQQVEPMDYTPAPATELDHDVTMQEIQEYFVNYMLNDSLGIICNAHVAFADQNEEKAMSGLCIELAELFSIAVDFPKTGVPAVIPAHLHVKEFPDYMEKSDREFYYSNSVIGDLFRAVKEKPPLTICIHSFTHAVARSSYDREMEYPGYEDYIDDACYYKGQYDFKLGKLMQYYGIKTEAELLSGNIMKVSRSLNRRQQADAVSLDVKALRKEARRWFHEGTARGEDELVYAKASAWYHVTYHPTFWGYYNEEGSKREHCISFPWCVYDKLIHIKKENAKEKERSRGLSSSLSNGFRYGCSLGAFKRQGWQ